MGIMVFLILLYIGFSNALLDGLAVPSSADLVNLINHMNSTFNNEMSKMQLEITNLKQELAVLRNSSHKTVAFSATLTKSVSSLGDKQVIVYDRVLTNAGNGYSRSLGHFTAPVQGSYYFAVTAMGNPNEVLSLNIVKNGSPIEEVYSGNTGAGYTSSSEGIVVQLAVGDTVWVVYNAGSRYIHCCNYNSFSGFLL